MHASLEVDANYKFTWKIGEGGDGRDGGVTSTLTDVVRRVEDDSTAYSFHLASGEFISLNIGKESTTVAFSALYAMCAPKTPVDENAIAPLLAATAASRQQKQDFAKCSFHGEGAEVPEQDTFTVRPSLDGHGAIFEDDASGDSDQSFVLLARRVAVDPSSRSSVYSGEGGVAIFAAGQHVSSMTELTVTNSSPATVQWDWQEQLPNSSCEVTGAAYASTLLR
jgi:hypothetical protein